jgi:hypothetical protein
MYTYPVITAIPKQPDNSWIRPAQWLALISMSADHLARYLQPGNMDYYWLAATLGRLAFPLFAAMLAWHLLFNSQHPGRYTLRILLIALLAQPFYALMIGLPLTYPALNVCFTLAAGLLFGWLLKTALYSSSTQIPSGLNSKGLLALVVAGSAAWLLAPWVDYGMTGILLVPALLLFFYACNAQQVHRSGLLVTSLLLCAWLGVGLNSSGLPTFSSLVALGLILLVASHSSKLRHISGYFPALPRWLWLGFYPGHLLLIVMLSHAVRH